MRKKKLDEVIYLLHSVEDEDLPGPSIFLGATFRKTSSIGYVIRIALATFNMIIVACISLAMSRFVPEILYSIPIYATFIAISLYPIRERST